MIDNQALSQYDLVIYVANTVEGTAQKFVRHLPDAQRDSYIRKDQLLGDRALFWGGDNLLVLTSFPVEPAYCRYVKDIMGYRSLINKWPENPGISLSDAVMADTALIKWLYDHIGSARRPVLLPYAVTEGFSELSERLNRQLPNLRSPEFCSPETARMIHQYDSKSGIRELVSDLKVELDGLCHIPKGFTCTSIDDAKSAERYFAKRGNPFLIKPDLGESGMGILRVSPDTNLSDAAGEQGIDRILASWPWKEESFVLEEEIQNITESPGVQIEIPRRHRGPSQITYICRQRLTSDGAFKGIELTPDVRSRGYEKIKKMSLLIGSHLQKRGYAGRCGLDFIIDNSGTLYFIEANLRRGGGTHVHAIAESCLGPDWGRMVTVSRDNAPLPHRDRIDFETFTRILNPVLFRRNKGLTGIVITTFGGRQQFSFSYVAMGHSISQVHALEHFLQYDRLLEALNPFSSIPTAAS